LYLSVIIILLLSFLNYSHIFSAIAYGRNFRGAGHVWTTCPGSLLGNAAAGSRTRDLVRGSGTPCEGARFLAFRCPKRSTMPLLSSL